MHNILNVGRRLHKRREVEARTGSSRSAIYAGMAAGTFPRPVRIGKRAVAWTSESIDAWIESRPPVSNGDKA